MAEVLDDAARSTRFRESWYTLDDVRVLTGRTLLRVMALENLGDRSRKWFETCWDFVSDDFGGLLKELGEKEERDGTDMQVQMGLFLDVATANSLNDHDEGAETPPSSPNTDLRQALPDAIALATKLMIAEHLNDPVPL